MRAAAAPSRGLQVAVATATANLLAYALSVVLSRQLGPAGFGEVAPLLSVVLVASVPGQALQAGIARRVATSSAAGADRLLVRSAVVGAAVAGGLVALSPGLRALLQLDGWAALLWTAVSLLPITVCFAAFGVLQGGERFRRLSAALVLLQLGRLVGGAAGGVLGGTAASALAGTALGLVAAAIACVALCRERTAAPAGAGALLSGLTRDSASVLAVLVLTNVDVLLARARLAPEEAGLYAAGALVAKMAFFAPSFVTYVLYARFSRPGERRAALRTGGLVVTGSAVLATAGAVVAGPLLPIVLGEDYAALQGSAWLFAAAGSALAAVFLLVQAGLAVHDHRLAAVAWAVAALEVVLVLAVADTLHRLVAVVLGGAMAVVAAGALLERTPRRRAGDEPALPTPGTTVA